MQISRLFQIIYILLEKDTTTATELAAFFEVSTRTIYRDIDVLSQAGIPIYTTRGKGGGIALVDRFVLNKSLFSDKEQNEILFALQSFSSTKYEEVDDVLLKVARFFKKSTTSWIEVDFSKWGDNGRQKEAFSQIKNAIFDRRVLTFSYIDSAGTKSKRQVEPAKLLFKDKAWYLQGFCLKQKASRTFKITRMMEMKVLDKSFTQRILPDSVNSAKKDSFQTLSLKLKLSAEGAYRVYDDFEEEQISKHEDGSFTVKIVLKEGEWIYPYLFSFGTALEVLEPMEVRKEMASRLSSMSAKYASEV